MATSTHTSDESPKVLEEEVWTIEGEGAVSLAFLHWTDQHQSPHPGGRKVTHGNLGLPQHALLWDGLAWDGYLECDLVRQLVRDLNRLVTNNFDD